MPNEDFTLSYSTEEIEEALDAALHLEDEFNEHYVTAGRKANTHAGSRSTAEGDETEASGDNSHAEGDGTVAYGWGSHAEGYHSEAGAAGAHAEGSETAAMGAIAHAEGYQTVASGAAAHAEGSATIASGAHSHVEGLETVANHRSQHVFGEYNVVDGSSEPETSRGGFAEIVGNGSGDDSRSNARSLDWRGNEVLAGKLTLGAGPENDMDAATKKFVLDAIAAAWSDPNDDGNLFFG